jgi:uncharacterized protein
LQEKDHQSIIEQTVQFVQQELAAAEAGHDWWHIHRVWKNTLHICAAEKMQVNMLVIELAALLHDIADSKFNNGDEEIGPTKAGAFLYSIGVDKETIVHVQQIIRNMSFKASLGKITFHSHELAIVQDADRLDAIGAIGIARAFTYGGYKNRELYNPSIPPRQHIDKEEYKHAAAPTINHFYEKLLLLKDKMNTPAARVIAAQRHAFMLAYLEQFYDEWNGIK